MKLHLPGAFVALISDYDKSRMSKYWHGWLRELWGNLGFERGLDIYDRLFLPMCAVNEDGATLGDTTLSGNITGRSFPAGSDEYVLIQARLPNNYRDGSNLTPYVSWAPSSTNTGDVLWSLEYAIIADGTAFPASTTETLADTAGGTALAPQLMEFTAIDGSTYRKSDAIVMRVGRVGTSVSDSFTGDAVLLGIGITYPVEGIGEKERHP